MPDMDRDTAVRQRPRSAAETFGEDVTDPDPLDQPTIPRSAQWHAQRRFHNDQEAIAARELSQIRVLSQEAREDAALERAIDLDNRHRPIPDGVRAQASNAIRRRGGSGLPTADQLAANALSRRQWQPMNPDQDRRHGRRPA